MIKTLKALGSILILAGAIQAGEITVSQSLDKFEMPYEDQAHFQIVLSWPGAQSAYLFDKPLHPQLENLKVKQFSSTISSTGSGATEVTSKTFDFTLVPTGSGQGKIEPVTISYVTWPDSVPGSLVTEAMAIRIAAALPKKAPTRWLTPVQIASIGGGCAIFMAVGVIIVVRSRARRPKEVVKTAEQLFLERMAQVKIEANGDLKRFQTGLYKQLVWYVNAKYGLGLTNQPTEEIVQVIDASTMPEAEKSAVGAWLIRADREKFSPAMPAPGETIRLDAEVREFFEKIDGRV
jgi:hypothetical protein